MIATIICWIEIFRCVYYNFTVFLLNAYHFLPPTHQENTCQTYVKTSATAHAQICQNISGHDLSNIYEEMGKWKANMPVELLKEGRMLKHGTTCQDTTCQTYMRKKQTHKSVDVQKQDRKFAAATAHAQTCQIMSGYHLPNIYE